MFTKDAIHYSLTLANRAVLDTLAGVADAPLTYPTENGGCHPLWVMGHLAFVEGMTHQLLGGDNPVAHWGELFGQDTTPVADATQYPAFATVRDQYVALRTRTFELLDGMSETDLDTPTPWQPAGLEEELATYGRTLLTVALHQMAHRAHLGDAVRTAGLGRQSLAA